MAKTLRCALIGSGGELVACGEHLLARGHGLTCVISACPKVGAWTKQRGLTQVDPKQDPLPWLTREPFDYLLSIVNHAITSPEVLATPTRGAINYHDSPLPEYAGFNATSWAILEGKSSHAVTWHEMTADVDGGRIFLQRKIEIAADDTAFTLAVKCGEAAVASFASLLEQMENDALSGGTQGPQLSFHFRSDRPDIALIDWSRPGLESLAMIRALDFGPDDNWMCRPKLGVPGGFLTIDDARLDTTRQGEAGRVLAISDHSIDVATQDGTLCFSALSSLDGDALSVSQVCERFSLREGLDLPALMEDLQRRARELDRVATKHERFWVQRLSTLRAPLLPDLTPHSARPEPKLLTHAWPEALRERTAEERRVAIVAALAAYLSRVNEPGPFDLALHVVLPDGLRDLYATTVPLRFDVDLDGSFVQLSAKIGDELTTHSKRQTYARDVRTRYRALKKRDANVSALGIGVRFCAEQPSPSTLTADPLAGTSLTVLVSDDGPNFTLAYDQLAISRDAATALASRLSALLEIGIEQPDMPVWKLPLLSRAEQDLLLTSWQDTARPYASDRCIHELFEAQVQATPDATALVFQDDTLTYRELNQRANLLAHTLRQSGVRPDTLVGICIERSLDMVVGLLGILKAGAAYVPLDPAYPRDRLAMMLEDSKAQVLVTQRELVSKLPPFGGSVVCVDELVSPASELDDVASGARPESLAYVIFTSGSTGRPKGVMVEHRNVSSFFTGMDDSVGSKTAGVWLAVTSISFDISVLELLWTLTRGFEVVIQGENDRASLARQREGSTTSSAAMDFGLFYFAADSSGARRGNPYRLLLEGAKFADSHGFKAVWTPERHFHAFGGLYPNPAVTTAALATITQNVQLRAGSVVLPLHNPLRVAEDWAVIDQLSGGRVGLSFASGWHVNDFAFMPANYERRREIMCEHIETVMRLWCGDKVSVPNGAGEMVEVSVLPRPYQERPDIWLASAGSVDTFKLAGRLGANVLTNMLGQGLADLKVKFAAYREARREHGHVGEGTISVMLHTFVSGDTEQARELARKPFCDYLASSFDLVKVAPFMFPAFKAPSHGDSAALDASNFTPEDMAALLDHAFNRYFESAGLFGTPQRAMRVVDQLKAIGATEVACLIDFGIDEDVVLDSLVHLDQLRQLANPAPSTTGARTLKAARESFSMAEQIQRRRVTHLQCTPTMARMLLGDPESRESLRGLNKLLLGGEALPPDLAESLAALVSGDIVNMYGPTETTVWSTTAPVSKTGGSITIGKPIANTVVRVVDARRQLMPIGAPGELCIGGAGVTRGYLERPDLTLERFVPDPYAAGQRLYRTGDLVRHRADGCLEFLGRIDQQVKVDGYRIELGEIEAALARHPSVRECVVAARSDEGPQHLVGYVVLKGQGGSGSANTTADEQRVQHWQQVWDETYKQTANRASPPEPRFNIAGWNSSYTGEPLTEAEMREWRDATVQRILALKPQRVLEIGCGTGMFLYAVSPHVEHYTGVDLSPQALESIRLELTPDEQRKVTLLQQPAHALEGVVEGSVDTVIVNSVVQYFPDAEYLLGVLRRACDLVSDGGRIFIGDVRSLAHLQAMHTVIELQHAAPHAQAGDLVGRIERRVKQESELVLSDAFFHALKRELPRVSDVQIQLKRGLANNELSCFRYDVVLSVGSRSAPDQPAAPLSDDGVAQAAGSKDLADIAAQLAAEPSMLVLTDVLNARLSGIAAASRLLQSDPSATAEQLRALREGAPEGIDPEALYTLHPDYETQIRWARSLDPWCFDAVLCHRRKTVSAARWPLAEKPVERSALSYANQPAKPRDAHSATDQLRIHLRETLPEYMVPTRWVVLDALPQTPNGKTDRRALPAPQHSERSVATPYIAPTNNLEQQIAGVWKQLLHVEQVGRKDNIFDMGANSLLTAEAGNRLSALLGRKVSLVSMFRFPTVESLAAHLGDAGGASAAADPRAQARETRRKSAAEMRRQLRADKGTT